MPNGYAPAIASPAWPLNASETGVESLWTMLQRGHHGIMSRKRLYRHLNQFAERHNANRLGKVANRGRCFQESFPAIIRPV